MGVRDDELFAVEALPAEEGWELFSKAVGAETINSSQTIADLARDISEECQGLPLAIVTVGRALAKEGMDDTVWDYARRQLRRRSIMSSLFSSMPDLVFSIFKLSYGLLKEDVVKSCFIYCSLLPMADRDQLIDYWIGEGILEEPNSRYRGYTIIEGLVKDCLLMAEGSTSVRMHDITREVALYIAKTEGEKWLVRAGAYLTEAPEVAEWNDSHRVSLMSNGIEIMLGSPDCPNLSTLILSKSGLKFIPHDFFKFMPSLKVLDLSWCEMEEIPRSVVELVKLEYLNISHTNITVLPAGLENLSRLKVLDMSYTNELNAIPQKMIARLSRLLVLNVYFCGYHEWIAEGGDLLVGSEEFIEELERLENLNHLGISIKDVQGLKRLLSSRKIQLAAHSLLIMKCKDLTHLQLSSMQFMVSLRELEIRNCDDLENIQISHDRAEMPSSLATLKYVCFYNLRHVRIKGCWSLEELTWLSFVPNLETLHVHRCMNLKVVIGDQAGHVQKEDPTTTSSPCMFPGLKSMCLSNLPDLSFISRIGMSFCVLEEIRVSYCPNLKELPFGSTSSIPEPFKLIGGQRNWWNKLEWKDKDIKKALLDCFRDIPY